MDVWPSLSARQTVNLPKQVLSPLDSTIAISVHQASVLKFSEQNELYIIQTTNEVFLDHSQNPSIFEK